VRSSAGPREGRVRDGQRIARLFRQSRGLLDVRACNLDEILLEDQLELAESWFPESSYAAALIRSPDWKGGGIMLPKGQDGGRRRFSIAHELGHYHIPSHSSVNGFCSDADMRARSSDSRQREWEANDFAAELLMPHALFSADVGKREISAATAIDLAGVEMYNVSVMAAAWRVIQTTRERAAIVVSTGGTITWAARSSAFSFSLMERNQALHPDSVAAAAFRKGGITDRPTRVPVVAWTDSVRPIGGELLESSYGIPSLNQIVSILWHVDADEDAATDEP
jgi:hypothetical protein